MKQVVGIGIVTAMLLTTGIGAQGRNFGGNWTVDTEKTIAAGGSVSAGGRCGGGGGVARSGGGAAAGTMVAVGGGGRGGGGARGAAAGPVPLSVSVDAKSFSITNGETVTTYTLDGSVKDMSTEVRAASAKASWQGDKVVIETTAAGPDGPIVTTASWYLEGEWLVRENTSKGPDGTPVSRKTYYKRG